jgi:hypothetical protein
MSIQKSSKVKTYTEDQVANLIESAVEHAVEEVRESAFRDGFAKGKQTEQEVQALKVQEIKADDKQEGGDHYKKMKITPWEAMQVWLSHEEFLGFLKGCAIKRLARSNVKDGLIDVRKAKHELEKYIEEYDNQ